MDFKSVTMLYYNVVVLFPPFISVNKPTFYNYIQFAICPFLILFKNNKLITQPMRPVSVTVLFELHQISTETFYCPLLGQGLFVLADGI